MQQLIQLNNSTQESKSNKAIRIFNDLIQIIEKSQWKKALSRAQKQFNMKVYNLEKVTPNRLKEMYQIIVQKFYENEKCKEYWHENQLRVFVWLLFAYSWVLKKAIEEFEAKEWEILSIIFLGKSQNLFEFQYHSLKKLNDKSNKWSQQQDELLLYILKQKYNKNKWNEIAKQFYIQSNKNFFRTPKQCRERWNNYLDPTKSKESWSLQQDSKLIKLVQEKGKKWSSISKTLLDGKRTQHMVKNRFNSLVAKYIKQTNKQLSPDSIELEQLDLWIEQKLDARLLKEQYNEAREKSNSQQQSCQKKNGFQSIKLEIPQKQPVVTSNVINNQTPNIKNPSINEKKKTQMINQMIPLQQVSQQYIPQQNTYQQKSPMILVSPIIITNFTPITFSPYNNNDFNMGFHNQFSFQRLHMFRSNNNM